MMQTLGKLWVNVIMFAALSSAALAHELRPAVADVTVGATDLTLKVVLNAEAMLAGVDQSAESDTNDTPQAAAYDALRALDDAALAAQFTEAWADLGAGFSVTVGGQAVPLDLTGVEVVPEPDAELPRDTIIQATATLPTGDAGVSVGWQPTFGPLVVRQIGGDETAYQGFLNPGDVTPDMARTGADCGWPANWL